MKIIILIIANDSPTYLKMQGIWRKYMNLHPNIHAFFIKSDPNILCDIFLDKDNDTIFIKDTESLIPGIYNKTIRSIEYCLRTIDFDFIYRTNLSSFLDLNGLYEFFLSNKIDYGGYIGNHESILFASGSGFILSREASIYLINNTLESELPDDVIIAKILSPKYSPQFIPRNDIQNSLRTSFHYRCKSSNEHINTCEIMNSLYSISYQKMRLTTVLASTNNNPDYYRFIPKQIIFWGKIGIRFIAVYIGDCLPEELIPYSDNIIIWSRNLDLHSAYVAQMIRLYYTAVIDLPNDELVMITDMDMLPCSPQYYKDGFEGFQKQDFIYYRHIDEAEKQIYMCYNAAHPSIWGTCFGVSTIDDIERKLYENYQQTYNGIPGSNGWYTDQIIMYDALIKYPYLKILNRPLRRLEIWMYHQHLCNGDTDFFKKYDDCHFHRSYSQNQALIADAERQIFSL